MEVRTMNYELVVRKRIASFLERILQSLGYDFRHEVFKKIIYSEMEIKTETEQCIKNYYDAFLYLLSNHKNPFTEELLNKFFYILKGKEISTMLTIKFSSTYFWLLNLPIVERAIVFHMYVYEELLGFLEHDRIIISLMLLNYILVKGNIPCIRILKKDFLAYQKAHDAYRKGNIKQIYDFIIGIIRKEKFQKKSFYKNLIKVNFKDIYQSIKQDQQKLQEEYGIEHICVYGSFSKGEERIDSDIDFLVVFKEEVLELVKTRAKEKFKEHYEKIFHRFVDLTEISLITNDRVIKEMTSYKQIF